MKAKFYRVVFLLGFLAGSFSHIFGQTGAIVITVELAESAAEINPYVFGINHGPWSEVSLDMQEEAREVGFTFLRWPGGNWGDRFNLTKPQIDLFMIQARNWNAEPSIHVRLEGGTPEQAAELVRYTNIEKEYGVRYWYIGNEPNLFDEYTLEQFIADWQAFAVAMREVDPEILLIGPEISQFPDAPDDYHHYLRDEWLQQFLLANGDFVDIVSVHRYPFPLQMAGDPTTIAQMRENVPRWRTLVGYLRETIQETTGHELPIAITEVNSHWSNSGGGIASPDSYYNAIWWSGVLTTLVNEQVDIVTYWLLSSVGSNGAFGILDRYNPRPTYYTYQLYKDFGLTRLVSASSDPYITVLASRRDDGAVTIVVTNLYEEDVSIQLDLQGINDESLQEARLLAPDRMAEIVDVEDYFDGSSLNLPGQSAMRLVLK